MMKARGYDWIPEGGRANLYTACGKCLDRCLQGTKIPDWLQEAHAPLCREEDKGPA